MIISTDPDLFTVDGFVDVRGWFEDDRNTIPPYRTQAVAKHGKIIVYGWTYHVLWMRGEKTETCHRKVVGSVNIKKNGEAGQRTTGQVPYYVYKHTWQDGDTVVDGWQLGWKFSDEEHKARVYLGNDKR